MTNLWIEATEDHEANRREELVSSVRVATANIWPVLAQSLDLEDYAIRKSLVIDRIHKECAKAAPLDFAFLAQAVEAAYDRDIAVILSTKQAELAKESAKGETHHNVKVEIVKRLNNSQYGNPRFNVNLHHPDGTVTNHNTMSDASANYDIENVHNSKEPVSVELTGTGNIRSIMRKKTAARRQYGDQRACRACGADIEWHGKEHGWLDRGGNKTCSESFDGGWSNSGLEGKPLYRNHAPYEEHLSTISSLEKKQCPTCGNTMFDQGLGTAWCGACGHREESEPHGMQKEESLNIPDGYTISPWGEIVASNKVVKHEAAKSKVGDKVKVSYTDDHGRFKGYKDATVVHRNDVPDQYKNSMNKGGDYTHVKYDDGNYGVVHPHRVIPSWMISEGSLHEAAQNPTNYRYDVCKHCGSDIFRKPYDKEYKGWRHLEMPADDHEPMSDNDTRWNPTTSKVANQYIKKDGDSWVITQKGTGKILSHHSSQEEAQKAFEAMEAHKHASKTAISTPKGPFYIRQLGKQYAVVDKSGEVIKEHPNKQAARLHQKSLYKNNISNSPKPTNVPTKPVAKPTTKAASINPVYSGVQDRDVSQEQPDTLFKRLLNKLSRGNTNNLLVTCPDCGQKIPRSEIDAHMEEQHHDGVHKNSAANPYTDNPYMQDGNMDGNSGQATPMPAADNKTDTGLAPMQNLDMPANLDPKPDMSTTAAIKIAEMAEDVLASNPALGEDLALQLAMKAFQRHAVIHNARGGTDYLDPIWNEQLSTCPQCNKPAFNDETRTCHNCGYADLNRY